MDRHPDHRFVHPSFLHRAALSEDFRDDVRKFDRPTLVIHGDDDQIVPIDGSAHAVARLLPAAELRIYEGLRTG